MVDSGGKLHRMGSLALRLRSVIGSGLFALVSGCMPIYPGMPSPVALLHQQGELAIGFR